MHFVSGIEQQLQQQTITIRKYVGTSATGSSCGGGGVVGGDTESTLSNVTSIHSQLQSLNETGDDAQKFYNSSLMNHQHQQHQQQLQQQLHQPAGSDKLIRPQVLRAMNKHSVLLQELHQRQTQAAASRNTQLATATTNLQQHLVTGCTATLTITTSTVTANASAVATATATVSAAAAAAAASAVVSPNKVATQMPSAGSGGGGGKTATILVSKSKTKTGLPLLLKNSINN
ncbi:AT-rich binding protein-like [Anastrepha ludens]|uniref:AT-rich binding protein-like n=1 Tax=Anastrepha ludens TaxID=28586 RepID=UPI0023AFD1FD|nr:AT-rich binding protein-like [Anastrepha ludens]